MMHAMKNNTHALVSSNKRRSADDQPNGAQSAPPATDVTERNQQLGEDACENETDAETTCEDHSWAVTIADRPADEVGMELIAKGGFDFLGDVGEG
jgi:hypothetical protein